MFTMCFQPPATDCTPASVSLDWFWTSLHETPSCYPDIFTDLTWTNPCGETYSVSYHYECWLDQTGPFTLEYTSGTFTNSIPPGVTAWDEETFGPVPVALSGPGTHGYLKLYMTYPDTSVHVYTSYTADVDYCT